MKKLFIILVCAVALTLIGCDALNFVDDEAIKTTDPLTVTDAPKKTEEPLKPSVQTKIEYSKEVVIPEEYKNLGGNYLPHRVFIPEIIDDGEAVKTLNEEMYSIGKDYVDLLKRNGEDQLLVNISYTFTEKDGIFGILIENRCGKMGADWWNTYFFFYYDSVNNATLTEDEYYLKTQKNKSEIWQRIQSSPEFIMAQETYSGATLDMAIFDDEIIYAVVNTPNGIFDSTMVTVAMY